MHAWLVRGCVMGLVNAAVQTALAKIAIYQPADMSTLRPIAVAVLVGIACLWGAVDGWRGTPGRGMTWFYAALVGGEVAGLFGVIGQAVFVDQTGVWALGSALTVSAAFSALLIMVPAALGVAVGGRILAPGRPSTTEDADPAGTQQG